MLLKNFRTEYKSRFKKQVQSDEGISLLEIVFAIVVMGIVMAFTASCVPVAFHAMAVNDTQTVYSVNQFQIFQYATDHPKAKLQYVSQACDSPSVPPTMPVSPSQTVCLIVYGTSSNWTITVSSVGLTDPVVFTYNSVIDSLH